MMLRIEKFLRRFPTLHQPLCRKLGHHIKVEIEDTHMSNIDSLLTIRSYCRSCHETLAKPLENIHKQDEAAKTLEMIHSVLEHNQKKRDFIVDRKG